MADGNSTSGCLRLPWMGAILSLVGGMFTLAGGVRNMKHTIGTLMAGLVVGLLTVVGFSQRTAAVTAPTYDEVIAAVDSAHGAFDAANTPSERFFLKRLEDAKKNLIAAKTQAAANNKRGVGSALRNVMAAFRGILQRLNSRTGKSKIAEPVRSQLVAQAKAIQVSVGLIKGKK